MHTAHVSAQTLTVGELHMADVTDMLVTGLGWLLLLRVLKLLLGFRFALDRLGTHLLWQLRLLRLLTRLRMPLGQTLLLLEL